MPSVQRVELTAANLRRVLEAFGRAAASPHAGECPRLDAVASRPPCGDPPDPAKAGGKLASWAFLLAEARKASGLGFDYWLNTFSHLLPKGAGHHSVSLAIYDHTFSLVCNNYPEPGEQSFYLRVDADDNAPDYAKATRDALLQAAGA